MEGLASASGLGPTCMHACTPVPRASLQQADKAYAHACMPNAGAKSRPPLHSPWWVRCPSGPCPGCPLLGGWAASPCMLVQDRSLHSGFHNKHPGCSTSSPASSTPPNHPAKGTIWVGCSQPPTDRRREGTPARSRCSGARPPPSRLQFGKRRGRSFAGYPLRVRWSRGGAPEVGGVSRAPSARVLPFRARAGAGPSPRWLATKGVARPREARSRPAGPLPPGHDTH